MPKRKRSKFTDNFKNNSDLGIPSDTSDTNALGNTTSKAYKGRHKDRYRNFFITWCDTSDTADTEVLPKSEYMLQLIKNNISDKFLRYAIQDEIGDKTQRKHVQAIIMFQNAVSSQALQKLFPGIHLEKPDNIINAFKYCTKQETRDPNGKTLTFNMPIIPKERKPLKPALTTPYKWQQDILTYIQKEPNDREILWIWSEEGNIGKTKLSIHITRTTQSIVVSTANAADIYYAIAQYVQLKDLETVILDIPRSTNMHSINYSAIEKIKDGCIFSTKYESQNVQFNSPHVIIFANQPPVIKALSEDRWKIIQMTSNLKDIGIADSLERSTNVRLPAGGSEQWGGVTLPLTDHPARRDDQGLRYAQLQTDFNNQQEAFSELEDKYEDLLRKYQALKTKLQSSDQTQ